MKHPLWQLEHVSLGAGRSRRLDDVTLTIGAGATAVVGYSGAGKTSLLNLLVEFERPSAGRIARSIESPARLPVAWVPENDGLWPHLTTRQHLELVAPADRQHEVAAWLARFDLTSRADAKPGTLSRGERSRLSLARAICTGAAVLVLDEPLAHVDPARLGDYWRALREYRTATDTSIVFATHQPERVLLEADDVICLRDGRCVYAGPVDELYHRPPNSETAAFLGPANWIAPDAAGWLTGSNRTEGCIRPERLAVEPSSDSRVLVESARFGGVFAEVELLDEVTGRRRMFVHRPAGNTLRQGDRVCVRVIP